MISHKLLIFHLSTNLLKYTVIHFFIIFSLYHIKGGVKLSFNHESKRREKYKQREGNEGEKERRKGKKKPLLVLKLA